MMAYIQSQVIFLAIILFFTFKIHLFFGHALWLVGS